MINQVIVKYFKEGINNNNSVNSLKSALLKAGWNKIDIEDSANVALVNKEKRLPIAPSASAPVSSASLGRKERPIGVSILAVLIWIGAGIFVIQFLVLLVSSIFGARSSEISLIGVLGVSILYGIAVFLSYLFGRGIWRGDNGWRVFYLVMSWITLVFSIIGILFLSSLLGALGGIVGIVAFLPSILISAFWIWYLGYKKNVVEFFHK